MKPSQIAARISATIFELNHTKPRSRRRTELELRLLDLRLRQLRAENRIHYRLKRQAIETHAGIR